MFNSDNENATFDVIGYNKKTFDDCVSGVDNIESDVKMVMEHCNYNKNNNKNNNNMYPVFAVF